LIIVWEVELMKELIFGRNRITSGATSDLERASKVERKWLVNMV
jgi:ATP-dependent Zn protease